VPRILIVDDHPIFRVGMEELLNQEEDFSVCAVAEDIHSARQALLKNSPDLAIVDISLAHENGLDLVKEITAEVNCIPVLVLSMHDESVWAERAIRSGARGYVMKKEASETIILAIRNILNGKIHVSTNMISSLLDKFHKHPDGHGASTAEMLTDREFEVFRLIGQGLSTRKISERMNLGIKPSAPIGTGSSRNFALKTPQNSPTAPFSGPRKSPSENILALETTKLQPLQANSPLIFSPFAIGKTRLSPIIFLPTISTSHHQEEHSLNSFQGKVCWACHEAKQPPLPLTLRVLLTFEWNAI